MSRDFGIPWTGTRNSIVVSIALRITANTTSSSRECPTDRSPVIRLINPMLRGVNYFAVGHRQTPNP